jgi:hypothetical protein
MFNDGNSMRDVEDGKTVYAEREGKRHPLRGGNEEVRRIIYSFN